MAFPVKMGIFKGKALGTRKQTDQGLGGGGRHSTKFVLVRSALKSHFLLCYIPLLSEKDHFSKPSIDGKCSVLLSNTYVQTLYPI